MGVTVKILKANRYGNERGRAVDCKVGDLLTTTANYAQGLIDAGSACWPTATEASALDEPEQAQEPAVTPFTVVDGISDDVAAALDAMGATWESIHKITAKSLQKVPGVGPKLAEKLKERAALEVAK